tara:strand:+ start:58 stop:1659 length:1602 start_codon:yes stop_codon:yes gene_type:complete
MRFASLGAVCEFPYYREHVLEICPQLERLDQIDVIKSTKDNSLRGGSSYTVNNCHKSLLRNKKPVCVSTPNYMKKGTSSELRVEKFNHLGEEMKSFLDSISKAKQDAQHNKEVIDQLNASHVPKLPVERSDFGYKYKFGEQHHVWDDEDGDIEKPPSTTKMPVYVPRMTESAIRRAEEIQQRGTSAKKKKQEESARKHIISSKLKLFHSNGLNMSINGLEVEHSDSNITYSDADSSQVQSAVPYKFNDRTFDDDSRQKMEDIKYSQKQIQEQKQTQRQKLRQKQRQKQMVLRNSNKDDELNFENPTVTLSLVEEKLSNKISSSDEQFLNVNNANELSDKRVLQMQLAHPQPLLKSYKHQQQHAEQRIQPAHQSPFSKLTRRKSPPKQFKPLSESAQKKLEKLATPKKTVPKHNDINNENVRGENVAISLGTAEHLRSLAKPKKVYKLVEGVIVAVNGDDLSDMTQKELLRSKGEGKGSVVSMNQLMQGFAVSGTSATNANDDDDDEDVIIAKDIFKSKPPSPKKVPIHPKVSE